MVVVARTHKSPSALLRTLKQIERDAGRRGGQRWGARVLDIDIIDYAGLVQGWQHKTPQKGTRPGGLVLPHPGAHERDFVLGPLAQIAPEWKHPVYRKTADELLARLPKSRRFAGG